MAKHPALFLALIFGGGILCAHVVRSAPAFVALIFGISLCSVLALFTRPQTSSRTRLITAFLLCAGFSAGMLRATFADHVPAHEISRCAEDNREAILLGQVLDAPEQRRDYWRVRLAALVLQQADSTATALQGTVLASGKQLQNLALGEHVILRGRLRLADEARNPGAFDYRAYLRANDICALFYSSDSTPVWTRPATTRLSLPRLSARVRSWVEKQIAAFANGQARALINGLLLGQTEELDPGVMESFARTGLIHILSVSGLHVGFMLLILKIAASLLRFPRRWQWPLVLLALWCYAYLTGMKPPIVRACVMATVLFLGRVFERDTNLPNNLGASALLILLAQPLQLFQLGFQLSFLAMFGIAYLYQPILAFFAHLRLWRWSPLHWAVKLLAVSLAAQLATLPVLVLVYGRLPLTALWGNLVVIPLSFIALATATLACAFAPLSDFVMQAYGAVAEITAAFMIAFTQWLATLPWAYIEGVHFAPLLLLFYLIFLAVFVLWRKPLRTRLLIVALLVLNLHVWNEARHATPRLRITFFDVGQGDAALLEFPQGRRLLIDTGPWLGETNAGTRVLAPFLHRQGIRRLEGVIISHPHADHLGGLPGLLAAIKIDTVYLGEENPGSELQRRCLQLLDSLHVPYRVVHAGARLHISPAAEIIALCTGAASHETFVESNLNETSLVLKVIYGQVALLFPGDAELLSEAHLLQHARALDSDLLKVAHHGSRTSSSEAFLGAVTPQWAVMSLGRRNRFDHPHQEIVQRFDRLKIPTLRTDQTGAVIFETEGKSLKRLR